MSTKYTITVNGTDVATRTGKPAALKLALDEFEAADSMAYVTVTTEAGTVIDAHVPAGRFGLWQRVEVPSAAMPSTFNDGVLAYVRKRINTGVYRFADKSYLVVDFRGESPDCHVASNTTEAREITNRLAAEAKQAKELVSAGE